MKKLTIVLILLITAVLLSFAGCGEDDAEKTITISADKISVQSGERIFIDKQASFSPFYQNNIKYEFVENEAGAEFIHELDKEKNWYNTYVVGKFTGKATVKLSYVQYGEVVAQSNTVTLSFTAIPVKTPEELAKIANTDLGYELKADIDLSSVESWTPITGFTGGLDGNGYKIKGLKINSMNGESVGLFDTLSGTVKNLIIEDAQVSAKGNAGKIGIIAGTNDGVISECTVYGTVDAPYYDYVGGICGYSNKSEILKCNSYATVTGHKNVGGIVGYGLSLIDNAYEGCTNHGTVTGIHNVGGVAGNMVCNGDVTITVSNISNKGAVTGEISVGGVIGAFEAIKGSMSATALTNEGKVVGTGEYVGGIYGYGTSIATLSLCENKADVTGEAYVGGVCGYSPSTGIQASGIENKSAITGKYCVGGFAGECGIVENATNSGEVIATGVNTDGDVVLGGIAGYCTGAVGCKNNADVVAVAKGKYVGGIAAYVKVRQDDVLKSNENSGAVSGSVCVGGIAGYVTCKTSNDTYNITGCENRGDISGDSQVGGAFGEIYAFYKYVKYSEQYNSYFAGAVLNNSGEVTATGNDVGGLIGKATRLTTLSVCESLGNVTGGTQVGGFVGYAPDTNIQATGTKNNATITGVTHVGGFAGRCAIIENATNDGQVIATGITTEGEIVLGGIAGYCTGAIDCVNNVDISTEAKGRYVGGIAGYGCVDRTDAFKGCVNNGNVSAYDCVGGIAGYLTCVTSNATYNVSDCKNYGTVNGHSQVGGAFGEIYAFYKYVKYSEQYNSYFTLASMLNEGQVTGSEGSMDVGGIVGKAARLTIISASENKANVTGEKCVGGLLGYAPSTKIQIIGTQNYAAITGTYYVGGFAGYAGVIEYATNNGTVTSIGLDENGNAYIGGIAGHCDGLVGCVNNGEVNASAGGKHVGGLAGFVNDYSEDKVKDSVNNGTVTGGEMPGDIIGNVN